MITHLEAARGILGRYRHAMEDLIPYMTPVGAEERRLEVIPSILSGFYPGVPKDQLKGLRAAFIDGTDERAATMEEAKALAAALRSFLPDNQPVETHHD